MYQNNSYRVSWSVKDGTRPAYQRSMVGNIDYNYPKIQPYPAGSITYDASPDVSAMYFSSCPISIQRDISSFDTYFLPNGTIESSNPQPYSSLIATIIFNPISKLVEEIKYTISEDYSPFNVFKKSNSALPLDINNIGEINIKIFDLIAPGQTRHKFVLGKYANIAPNFSFTAVKNIWQPILVLQGKSGPILTFGI